MTDRDVHIHNHHHVQVEDPRICEVIELLGEIKDSLRCLTGDVGRLTNIGVRTLTLSSDIQAAVQRLDSVEDGLMAFIDKLKADLAVFANVGDVAGLQNALNSLTGETDKIAAAIMANTPAEPDPAPPVDPPVEPAPEPAPEPVPPAPPEEPPVATDPNAPQA